MLASGDSHVCTLTENSGEVYCWGNNVRGQLGIGNFTNISSPTKVSSNVSFTSIASGYLDTCALTLDNSAYCWGMNNSGQLGIGSKNDANKPTLINNFKFISIAPSGYSTCAISTSHDLYCWGSATNSTTPVAIKSPVKLKMVVTSGRGGHSCALSDDDEAYCWGDNDKGQLGYGKGQPSSPTPVPVSGGLKFIKIRVGFSYTCGITDKYELYCWGDNFKNELGIGADITDSPVPTLAFLNWNK
jgi:alpha-tubulin suppressor-like RCC1 family protein